MLIIKNAYYKKMLIIKNVNKKEFIHAPKIIFLRIF